MTEAAPEDEREAPAVRSAKGCGQFGRTSRRKPYRLRSARAPQPRAARSPQIWAAEGLTQSARSARGRALLRLGR